MCTEAPPALDGGATYTGGTRSQVVLLVRSRQPS